MVVDFKKLLEEKRNSLNGFLSEKQKVEEYLKALNDEIKRIEGEIRLLESLMSQVPTSEEKK